MLTHQEVLHRALELKAEIEDLRSSTYIVENYADSQQTPYMFVASFDMNKMEFVYTLTDANFLELKGLSQASPEAIAAFGLFVSGMLAYAKGAAHPHADKLAAFNPDMVKPHDELRSAGFEDDRDIDDSEATL